MENIMEFKDKYRFLSNFWDTNVFLDGYMYPTVEHAFQAAKTMNGASRYSICMAHTPGQAKSLGRQVTMRKDWDTVKDDIMHDLVLQKFSDDKDLRDELLSTGDVELIEGNWWNDRYWGVCLKTGEGQNKLGKILMEVRSALTNQEYLKTKEK